MCATSSSSLCAQGLGDGRVGRGCMRQEHQGPDLWTESTVPGLWAGPWGLGDGWVNWATLSVMRALGLAAGAGTSALGEQHFLPAWKAG